MRVSFRAVTAASLMCLMAGTSYAQNANSPAQREPGAAAETQRQPAQAGQSPVGQNPTGQGSGLSPQQQQTGNREEARGEQQKLTQHIADMLMLANQCEIQVSQMAAEQATNPEVKELATMFVRDHSQMNEKLSQLASQELQQKIQQLQVSSQGAGRSATGDASNRAAAGQAATDQANRPGQATPGQGQSRVEGQAASGQQHSGDAWKQLCQLEFQAAQNGLEGTQRLLSKHQGQDFDMGFVGMQIASHTKMLAHLKAIQESGPSELQQLASTAVKTTQEHLQRAEQIAQRLKDEPNSAASGQRQSSAQREDGRQERTATRPEQR